MYAQRCIVSGACYEPEIDKAAAREILAYLMAGGRVVVPGAYSAGGKGEVVEEGGEKATKAKA